MESLGKQIIEANPEIYTDRVVGVIRGHIDKMMPNATIAEKESIYYRSVYDYWSYGSLIMEEFAYGFFDKTHEQKKEYITKKNFVDYYTHLNDLEFARNFLANKYNAYHYLRDYYARDAVLISSENDYKKFMSFLEKHSDFVVKPVTFDSGRGIHKESLADYGTSKDVFKSLLAEINNLKVTAPKKDFLSIEHVLALILEEFMNQVPEMAQFHPYSLNLVRITTVRVGLNTEIIYSSIKIGRNHQFLNNPAVGGFSAMINSETGIVETDFFDEIEHSQIPLEYHPDTHVKIKGFKIPRWSEAVSLAKECARKFERVNYVGWDLALTPRGWCVVEGNDYGGVVMPQIAYGRGMKKEFEDIIGWKLEKQFWWQ